MLYGFLSFFIQCGIIADFAGRKNKIKNQSQYEQNTLTRNNLGIQSWKLHKKFVTISN